MPAIPNSLLSVLLGCYLFQAKVDSIYWRHITTPVENLKSIIPLTQRQDGMWFYKAMGNQNIEYYFAGIALLVLASFFNPRALKARLLQSLACIVGFIGVAVLELMYTRPLIMQLQKMPLRVSAASTSSLYWISMYHLASMVVLSSILSTRMTIDEELELLEDEEEKKQQ